MRGRKTLTEDYFRGQKFRQMMPFKKAVVFPAPCHSRETCPRPDRGAGIHVHPGSVEPNLPIKSELEAVGLAKTIKNWMNNNILFRIEVKEK